MTQPMQFTIFTAEILANQFESSALVAGNLYEQFAGAGVDRRHLITESGDQRQCALSLSKGNQWPCALSLSKGTDYRLATPAPGIRIVAQSPGAGGGMGVEGVWAGVERNGQLAVSTQFPLYIEKTGCHRTHLRIQ